MIEGNFAKDLVGTLYTNDTNLHDMVVMTSHNSFVSPSEGYKIHNQQHLSLNDQFDLGIRGFMLDLHYYNGNSGDIYLCHGKCEWNSLESIIQKGPDTVFSPTKFSDWLEQYKVFSDKNKNEIVFIFLESYVKSQDINQTLTNAGLYDKLYKESLLQPTTLGQIREKQQTLIIINDYQNERPTNTSTPTILQGIHPTTDIIETLYALENDNNCGMRDTSDFRADPHSTGKHLFLFNHIAEISNPSVNTYENIMRRIRICFKQYSYPNFITIDFVDTHSQCNVLHIITQQIALSKEKNAPLSDTNPQNQKYSEIKAISSWVLEHWIASFFAVILPILLVFTCIHYKIFNTIGSLAYFMFSKFKHKFFKHKKPDAYSV